MSIISFNVNELNATIKRHKVAKCKNRTVCRLPRRDLLRSKEIQTESERMEECIPCKQVEKKAKIAIVVSEKNRLYNKDW